MTKLSMTLLLMTSVVLSGCANPSNRLKPVSIAQQCGAFAIIHPAPEDTMGTKRQILAHNMAYRGLKCPEKTK